MGNANALPGLPEDLPDVSQAPSHVRVIEGENLIAFAKALYTTQNDPNSYKITSDYSGVAKLYLPSGSGAVYGCSGGLLTSGMHILTAAHCVTDNKGNLDLVINNNAKAIFIDNNGNSVVSQIKGVTVHPNYDGDFIKGNDIAVIELTNEVPSGVDRYSYSTTDDPLGQPISKVGYGISGYLSSGADSKTYPFGTKRSGSNTYDAFGDTMYIALGLTPNVDFVPGAVRQFDSDDGSSKHDAFGFFFGMPNTGLGNNEVNSASGDSGGPSFDASGDITGITSYGITLQYTNRQTSDCTTKRSGPVLDSSCGEFSGDTRVSAYADFIAGILNNGSVTPSTDAVDDSYSTPYGTALIVNPPGVLSNDSGDSLSITKLDGPFNGSIIFGNAGDFTYTPKPGFSGTDSFIYSINGSDGNTDTANVIITVQPEPATSDLTSDITFGVKTKGPNTDLLIQISLDPSTSNIPIQVNLSRLSVNGDGGNSWNFSGVTDGQGNVSFSLGRALSDVCYTAEITNSADFTLGSEIQDSAKIDPTTRNISSCS